MTADAVSLTFGKLPVVQAEDVSKSIASGRLNMRTIGKKLPLELANSFHCPIGAKIGRGWLFMLRREVEKLASGPTYELKFKAGSKELILPSLYFVKSHRITSGISADLDSLHLVEIADKRWLFEKTTVNKSYNVRTMHGADRDYITSTLRDEEETPWTWKEITQDLWETFNPVTAWDESIHWLGGGTLLPNGTPENIQYHACSAWHAICDFVSRIGCQMRYNPIADTFDIVQMGVGVTSAQGETTMLFPGGMTVSTELFPQFNTIRSNSDKLMEDEESHKSANVLPSQIDVFFPANYEDCGEAAITMPYFKVSVTAIQAKLELANTRYNPALEFAHTTLGPQLPIRDPMHALFDSDDTETPTNDAELEERALSIAADWYAIQIDMASGRHVQSGLFEHYPGPFVSEVRYRAMADGMKTEIIREPVKYLPWHEMAVKDCSAGVELVHGVVTSQCNTECNIYRVQLLRRVLSEDCDYES